jgi:hypothetical protein
MALKSMSIEKSDEIMTLFFDLLAKNGDNGSQYYPYSAMKGYDVFDIDNGLKIFMANLVFNKDLSENEIQQYKDWADGWLLHYNLSFAPDEFVYELSKLDKKSSEYRTKESSYMLHPKSGMLKLFVDENKESIISFFDFCLSLKKDYSTYWKLVYNRLGIEEK